MKRALEALARGAEAILSRPLTQGQRDLFAKYMNILSKWQKSHRLIGSAEPMWIVEHLFLDSLLFLRMLPSTAATILDLGSGAGLPGLPMKIINEDLDVTLAESRRRRASFLSAAVRELALSRTRVISDRLEDPARELEGRFDAVVMRCAGDPTTFSASATAMLRPGGVVIATGPPKSRQTPIGSWREVDGPRGRRLFWVCQVP